MIQSTVWRLSRRLNFFDEVRKGLERSLYEIYGSERSGGGGDSRHARLHGDPGVGIAR
jgi:hypothetical protein